MSNRTIIVVLLIISVFGAGSIGLVWMRMEISAVAKDCGELEDELEIVAREVHELRAQYSRAMRPSSLASMVTGRLKMPKAQLTFHVSEADMERRLGNSSVAKRSQNYRARGEFAGTQ